VIEKVIDLTMTSFTVDICPQPTVKPHPFSSSHPKPRFQTSPPTLNQFRSFIKYAQEPVARSKYFEPLKEYRRQLKSQRQGDEMDPSSGKNKRELPILVGLYSGVCFPILLKKIEPHLILTRCHPCLAIT
jgi:hypothetical protein